MWPTFKTSSGQDTGRGSRWVGGASAVNGLVRLGRTRNANSMASCSFRRAPTGCWAQTSTGPQLTEVLRFVRAGDMVTVHSRAGGRRRPLAWSRSGTPQRRRRRRRWWPGSVGVGEADLRRMRRCCVVSPGDSRGVGFGVEGVSRRSRRLLVSRSRVDGLHRAGLRRCRTGSRCGHRRSGSRWCPRVGWCVRKASICRLLASRFH